MVGGVVSSYVPVLVHRAVLPQASVACQMRTAVKVLPQLPLVVVLTTSIRLVDRESVVEGKSEDLGGRRIIQKKKGQLMGGGVVSTNVTVLVQRAGFPKATVAW